PPSFADSTFSRAVPERETHGARGPAVPRVTMAEDDRGDSLRKALTFTLFGDASHARARLGDALHRVVGEENGDGTDHGDQEPVQIHAPPPGLAEERKDPPADDRANDAEHQVENEAFPGPVDDLAAQEPGDDAKDDPSEKRHVFLPDR